MKTTFFNLAAKLAGIMPQNLKQSLYRLGPFSILIRRFLNRVAPIGQQAVFVIGGGLRGLKLNLDLQTEKDYWLGTYEIDLQIVIQQNVQPGWVAYDVGANIGYISLLLAKMVGKKGKVFAFEALPANITRLRENLRLNKLEGRVQVCPTAVSDRSGSVAFLVGPSGAMGKVLGAVGRQDIHQETIEVQATALDDFVFNDGNPTPQVIKMDIEGGEILALRGMTRLISEIRPLLFLELHGPKASRVCWEVLPKAGYSIHRMKPGLPLVKSQVELDWKSYLVGLP